MDLKFFRSLRTALSMRFQARVDISEYEPKIKKRIDAQIGADELHKLCKSINLFDTKERE